MKSSTQRTPFIPPKVKPLYMPKPKQSRKDWEKLLQSIRNYYQKGASRPDKKSAVGYLNLDETLYRRRADAVLNLIDTVEERYRDLSRPNQIAVGEEWASMNMSYHVPWLIDGQYHILFAAAIWILENAEEDDEDNDLYSFLPTDETLLDDYFLPNVWHTQFEYELITSVEYVLDHRNDEDGTAAENTGRHGMLTDIASAKGEYPRSKARRSFEGLISLIPEEKITEATQAFETLYWRWTDAFFESLRPFYERLISAQNHFEDLRVQQNDLVDQIAGKQKELADYRRRKRETAKQKIPAYGPVMPVNPLPEPTMGFQAKPLIAVNEEETLIECISSQYLRIELLANEIDQVVEELKNATVELSDHCSAFMADAARPELEWVYEEVTDPFSLCFAYLYLLDTGSDLPWLYGSVFGFLIRALENLPWGIQEYDDEEDVIDAPDAYEGKKADIPDWHLRKYRKKGDACPRSLAQLLYERTGCLIPNDLHCYDSQFKELSKFGIRGKDAVTFLSVMAVLRQSKYPQKAWNFERLDYFHRDEIESAAAENDNLIPELKAEVDRLRSALHEADKAARQSRKALEEERQTAEMERRELADLRELIFRQLLSEEDETDADIDDAVFPYTVQNDTLVFGGHDTWVKAIKPLFKGNVRFVDKNYVFDPVIIRRTETIWIQTNAIAHKQFYRIVDAARLYKKTVRYFTYAGVKKCAMQIVENDGSGTKN